MSKRRKGGKEPYSRIYASAKDHPRVMMAGLDGTGLWLRALAYCADHTTNGFVPAEWLEGINARALKKAVTAGLIDKLDNGYVVHDYLDHNPSRDEIEERRAKERGKKAGNTSGIPQGNTEGKQAGVPSETATARNGEQSGDSSRLSYSDAQGVVQT